MRSAVNSARALWLPSVPRAGWSICGAWRDFSFAIPDGHIEGPQLPGEFNRVAGGGLAWPSASWMTSVSWSILS